MRTNPVLMLQSPFGCDYTGMNPRGQTLTGRRRNNDSGNVVRVLIIDDSAPPPTRDQPSAPTAARRPEMPGVRPRAPLRRFCPSPRQTMTATPWLLARWVAPTGRRP